MIRHLAKYSISATIGCLVMLFSSLGQGHGGVFLEDDLCVIQIGFFRAHFTVFQPRSRRHQEYCEDLPDVGETVFVLEYLHDGLQEMPIEFRLIRNTTGMGRFAKWSDISAIDDLDAITLVYQSALIDPDVLSVIHTFTEPGEYIGVVVSRSIDTDTPYTAVFPFTVGGTLPTVWLTIAGAVLAMLLVFAGSRLWPARRATQSAVAPLLLACLVLFTAPSVDAEESLTRVATPVDTWAATTSHFVIKATPREWPLRINSMHAWDLSLASHEGTPIAGAEISVSGGMPEHDHGLPTSPGVSNELTDGSYLIRGVKFHMTGAWEIELIIVADGVTEVATIKLVL